MKSEITDKTIVIVSRLGDFWVTPKQAETIMNIKQSDSMANIELEGNTIAVITIDGALTPEAYETYSMKRRGGWQCRYQKWHERNNQCAHGQMYR